MTSDITLVIPSFNNRHLYLRRALEYFKESHSDMETIVCDSSKDPFPDIKNFPGVRYLHTPGTPYTAKLFEALRTIRTTYTVFCADDDFTTPQGIKACKEFLDHNPDYSSAQGHLVAFPVPGKLKAIPWMFQIVGLDINDEEPTARILHFYRHHIYLQYSVHRTQNLLDTFFLSRDYDDIFAGGSNEYCLNIISLIHGKHKVVPVFYAAQELTKISGRNSVIGLATLRDRKEYLEDYRHFLERLSALLAQHQHINNEKAVAFFEDFFHDKLAPNTVPFIPLAISNPLSDPKFRHVKNILDKVKGTRKVKNYYSKAVYFLISKYAEIKKKELIEKQIQLTRNVTGFPFYDSAAKSEWTKIEHLILKHQNRKGFKVG